MSNGRLRTIVTQVLSILLTAALLLPASPPEGASAAAAPETAAAEPSVQINNIDSLVNTVGDTTGATTRNTDARFLKEGSVVLLPDRLPWIPDGPFLSTDVPR
jgi:hypothetical protein